MSTTQSRHAGVVTIWYGTPLNFYTFPSRYDMTKERFDTKKISRITTVYVIWQSTIPSIIFYVVEQYRPSHSHAESQLSGNIDTQKSLCHRIKRTKMFIRCCT